MDTLTVRPLHPLRSGLPRRALALALMLGACAQAGIAHAEVTDVASGPLISTEGARPNLLYLVDDSDNMKSVFLTGYENLSNGDAVNSGSAINTNGNSDDDQPRAFSSIGRASSNLAAGNGAYYNPAVTYALPINADGSLKAASTSTAAPKDGYNILYPSPYTLDLTPVCYSRSNATLLALSPPGHYFRSARMKFDGTAEVFESECKNSSDTTYNTVRARHAFYYQYDKTKKVTGSGAYDCTPTASVYPNVTEHRCFDRVDIISSISSYLVRAPDGTQVLNADGTNATRSYAQEIQNFANWFTWYRTRLNILKTASGYAFSTLGDDFRVGLLTVNYGPGVQTNPLGSASTKFGKYLKLAAFTGAHKTAWYTMLYAQDAANNPNLTLALSIAGRHYAGKTDSVNGGMNDDPIETGLSCQQNFTLLATSGVGASGDGSKNLDASSGVGNVDKTEDELYITRALGTYDGGSAGTNGTIADVAMFYYKTDLRPAMANNVFTTTQDFATHQHMTTFVLGLGVNGFMTYRPDYATATEGDFYKIKQGQTGCTAWQANSAICNWPAYAHDTRGKFDDLWHAAVNGRGSYFNASDPAALSESLRTALVEIRTRVGASAAAATSSPNITPTDNYIFSTVYRTADWDGELTAQRVNTTTGTVLPTVIWGARDLLNARVSSGSDTRTIHTFDGGAGAAASKLRPFKRNDLTVAERGLFENKCVAPFKFTHCGLLAPGELSTANSAAPLIDFLRGQTGDAGAGKAFRARQHVLGDIVSAAPHFLKAPKFSFNHDSYDAFKTLHTTTTPRQAVVYVGANDGMLHAFNADTGAEMWAYVPKMLFPELWRLADKNYKDLHRYYVDGIPETMDICVGAAPCTWKTILVSGLGAGGRGYYALDVTDPSSPKALWEFCSDAAHCAIADADLGFSFGKPVITKRKFDGKWVVLVTSGVNNVSPGDGKGYLYVLDAASGAVLKKVTTGAGDSLACTSPALCGPSGFSHLSVFAASPNSDNLGLWAYGGDLWGNVWRFDLSQETPPVVKLAELKNAAGKPQPVTTYPQLTTAESGSARVVFIGTGRFLGKSDYSDPASLSPAQPYSYGHSLYAIKDVADAATAGHGDFRAAGTTASPVVQQTITTNADGLSRTTSNNAVNWSSGKGWYMDFPSAGERMVLNPVLIEGTLLVTTSIPVTGTCTAGGDSWQYQLNAKTGGYLVNAPGQQAGWKKTGQLIVGNVVVQLPSGAIKVISTASTGSKETAGLIVAPKTTASRRMSWREILTP